MQFDYSGLATTAKNLIQRFGRDVTVQSKVTSGEAWNPVVSWNSATAKAVNVGLDKREIDSGLVQASYIAFIVESSAVLNTESRIIDGDKTLSVISVREIKPGGTAMLYRVNTRV